MKSTQYSKKVMEHFRNPRNVGVIENPDGYGKVGNPVCGDLMEMFLRIGENEKGEEIIEDIKFRTFGCGSAVATSSMTTELAMGMTVDEAYKITRNDVADELEGLPPIKMHCSNLAADALKAAIDNYREGKSPDVEVSASCKPKLNIILGLNEFMGKGVYTEVDDLTPFEGKRVLILDRGDESIRIVIDLTEHTGRVVLVTSAKNPPGTEELNKKLRRSDVKLLYQSELMEIQGELDEVEKVIVHDFDEDEKYELFVDAVIILEEIQN